MYTVDIIPHVTIANGLTLSALQEKYLNDKYEEGFRLVSFAVVSDTEGPLFTDLLRTTTVSYVFIKSGEH